MYAEKKSIGGVMDTRELRRFALKLYSNFLEEYGMDSDEFVVSYAIDIDTLSYIILEVLKKARSPISWKEMKMIMQNIGSEDRIRKAIWDQVAKDNITVLTHTRYVIPDVAIEMDLNSVKNPSSLRKIEKMIGKTISF